MESLDIVQEHDGDTEWWVVRHNDKVVYRDDLTTCMTWLRQHPSFKKWHDVSVLLKPIGISG